MPVQACTHVGITVTDLETARRFYIEGLGFQAATTSSGSDHKITATDEYGRLVAKLLEFDDFRAEVEFLKRDGMTIELVQYEVPSPRREPRRSPRFCGLTHMCFYVDDADETAAKLVALGGTILEHTDTYVDFSDDHKVRLLFLLDPDGGVKVELVQALA